MRNENMASTSVDSTQILTETEQKILNLTQTKQNGISNKDIITEIPDIQPAEIAQIINKLIKNGFVDLFKDGQNLLYKYKDPAKCAVKGSDNEEKVVYSIIEEAGNKGIWIRDIRHKSNLMMTKLNKVLKSLETKKLIKAVKSVSAIKKKVYMLYNLEPDSSVTGGAWYQDQDFEAEFVDVLNQQCFRFLEQRKVEARETSGGPLLARNKSYVSAKEVHKFISDLGISKVQLSVSDLETILYTLVLDGKAERSLSNDGSQLYRAIESLMPPPGLVKIPCGVCPMINRCADLGVYNAKDCNYLLEWLEE